MKKYEKLILRLTKELKSGRLKPGDRFYSDNELIKKFSVSNTTVEYAVRELVSQGFLRRIRGKGTFVSSLQRQDIHDTFWMVMQRYGHFHAELFEALVSSLQTRGHHSFMYSAAVMSHNRKRAERENIKVFSEIFENSIAAMILNGTQFLPFDYFVKTKMQKKMVFVHRLDTDVAIDSACALSDYYAGGYMAAKHLIDRGHEKIIIFFHKWVPYNKSAQLLLNGFQDACEECDLTNDENFRLIFDDESPNNYESLVSLLKSSWVPTAVFSYGDFRLAGLLPVLREAGISCPEDLALMGYYDTPWATMLDVPITSVNLRVDELARLACDMALRIGRGEDVHEKHLVTPKIVVREST